MGMGVTKFSVKIFYGMGKALPGKLSFTQIGLSLSLQRHSCAGLLISCQNNWGKMIATPANELSHLGLGHETWI